MGLGALQAELVRLVGGPVRRAGACPPALELSAEEAEWLDRAASHPGLDVTRHIQRWWRLTKISWATRLTGAALGAALAGEERSRYVETSECESLFLRTDAIGFLRHVLETFGGDRVVCDAARFELAMLRVVEAEEPASVAAIGPGSCLVRNPYASVVTLSTRIEELYEALVAGGRPPRASSAPLFLLVSPGLAEKCRYASPEEEALMRRCEVPTCVAELGGCDRLELAALVRDGALVVAPNGNQDDSM